MNKKMQKFLKINFSGAPAACKVTGRATGASKGRPASTTGPTALNRSWETGKPLIRVPCPRRVALKLSLSHVTFECRAMLGRQLDSESKISTKLL